MSLLSRGVDHATCLIDVWRPRQRKMKLQKNVFVLKRVCVFFVLRMKREAKTQDPIFLL